VNFKLISFLILSTLSIQSFSQLSVSVTTNRQAFYTTDGDTLSLCIDSLITLKAEAFNGGIPVISAHYRWDFDDNQTQSGIDLDSVTHIYTTGGGYRIKLFINDGSSEIMKIIPIHVSLKPEFKDTKNELPEGQTGICRGGKAQLLGKAHALQWKDKPKYAVEYNPAKEISNLKVDTFSLFFDEFAENAAFSDGNIDSVGFVAEHSDMGNIEIKLICPNNQSAVLKNFSATNHAFLGEPTDDEAHLEIIGNGFQYYWSTGALAGSMNNVAQPTITAAAYAPDGLMSDLNNCPMNGLWKLVVSDNSPADNGYTFSWQILFAKSVLPDVWTFRDTLVDYYQKETLYLASLWESEQTIGSTSLISEGDTILYGTATGRPIVTSDFKYNTVNSRGCPFDTTVVVKVERVKISVLPESLTIAENDTLSASITEGTVSWGNSYIWNFGDMTGNETTESVSHSYIKKGKYKLIVVVKDANECSDTDTAEITVILEPTELEMTFNCFTPNGDGQNDNFIVGKAKGMVQFNFYIFNEWGQKMYETNSVDEATKTGWDGRVPLTKMKASPGIYYYYIQTLGKDGTKTKNKGTLQLFR